jgi:putative DNA primase/helicase
LDWQRNGLVAPDEVKAATDSYRADMDTLGEFIDECCSLDATQEIKASDLYARYKTWAEQRGEYIETQTRFGTRLVERGFEKRKTGGRVWYRVIRTRDC